MPGLLRSWWPRPSFPGTCRLPSGSGCGGHHSAASGPVGSGCRSPLHQPVHLALQSRDLKAVRAPPRFSSRAQGGPVQRPAQKRDTRKSASYTAPFLLPCQDREPVAAAKPQRAHLFSTATCSLRSPGPKVLRRPARHRERVIYARSWIWTSENIPSRNCPKRGSNNAPTPYLAVYGARNGPKSTVSVSRTATQ